MPTNDISTDPALYELFERIVREAPPATQYRVDQTGTRADGSAYSFVRHFLPAEKDQLPWGIHDAIIDVTWCAPDWAGVPDKEFVKISAASHHGGILVVTTLNPGQHLVRLTESEHTAERLGLIRHGRTSENDVIAKVMEFIHDAIDATEVEHDDDGYYDEDRDDPLNELSTPARWR